MIALIIFLIYKAQKKKKISQSGIDFIKSFESLSLKVYKDSAGLDTIGWGHLIKKGEIFPLKITIDQADNIFLSDLLVAENIVKKSLKVKVSQELYDSLVSHAYNVGHASGDLYTLINKNASKEEIKYWWQNHYLTAGGVPSKGLKIRRFKESQNF